MGETIQCESFLPSMRDPTEDSNWSVYQNLPPGQYQHMRPAPERDFLKQTMIEHEAVFKNQVYELHRLYRTQKSLMDQVRENSVTEHVNQSEPTPESAIKPDLPGYLLGNSMCGEGSSSQAMQSGISSKDKEVLEVRPVKVRRKMIDLQLPPDAYLDTDGENTSCLLYQQSKPGKEVGAKMFFERGNTSHQNTSYGNSLALKNTNGLTDLNKPVQCQESVHVPSSRDMYSLYGRNIAHVQGQWLETSTSQNGWMVHEAGHEKSIPRDKLCLPSHSEHVLSNTAFQPLDYPSTDHRKLSGERASFEWDARQRNPEVSYSYVESSVASNSPNLQHGYRAESVRPWSHWTSSWDNRSSSSVQNSLPLQTNPFFNTQARADSISETRCHDSNRLCQGFSSGPKETACNFPSGNLNHLNNSSKGVITHASVSEALKYWSLENLRGPKKQESSAGLPWLKPMPPNKNEMPNGGLDLNASANQFMDGRNSSNSVLPRNGLRSVSCFNDANSVLPRNLGPVQMADSESHRKIFGFPKSQKHSIFEEHSSLILSSVCSTDQPREMNIWGKRNLDINLPCEASVSEAVVVDKEQGKKAATCRHYIDLNLCASEEEGLSSNLRVNTKAATFIDLEAPPALESDEEGDKLQEKRDEKTWGSKKSEAGDSVDKLIKAAAETMVIISLSHHFGNTDEAASSSTDAVAKDPLSWFVNTIASCGNDLQKEIDVCFEARECEGNREECSSGEFEYFEAMTLNLPPSTEENYMPKALVPKHLKFDGTSSMGITANRPRRGQARRGRPRRDFQRDILPGLSSLSRLEVSEDLQMFGGLMKATTGYGWNSRVARRSSNRGGSSRGRKRLVSNISSTPVCSSLVQPINNSVQMVGLEDRSLIGWGNATRRPRRQRGPAGTPPTVI